METESSTGSSIGADEGPQQQPHASSSKRAGEESNSEVTTTVKRSASPPGDLSQREGKRVCVKVEEVEGRPVEVIVLLD